MLTVKISSRGSARSADLSQFLGNADGRWDDCRFVVNESIPEADLWIVLEDLEDDDTSCRVSPNRVIFGTAETSWPPGFYAEHPGRMAFLEQFAEVHTPYDVFLSSTLSAAPFLPWMINANHGPSMNAPHDRDLTVLDAMTDVPKSRDLSVICSTQAATPSHRMRLRFVEQLAEHFGTRMDWFGNGVNPVREKWDGIAPYRYTIALENQAADRFVTEKIADAFLGLSFPIYWGAPDITEFYPAEALVSINIRDLAGSIATIERLVDSNIREERIPALLEARRRVLHVHNPYARMAAIAMRLQSSDASAKIDVRLRTMDTCVNANPNARTGGIMRTVGETFNRVGDTLVRRSSAT